MTLTEFLTARLDEEEAAARAAIQPNRPGIRWHWVDRDDDEPLDLDSDEYVNGSLRTVEEFPTSVVARDLPAFVITGADGVHQGAARHIERWDPERVLAEVRAKRATLKCFAMLDAKLNVHPALRTTGTLHIEWCVLRQVVRSFAAVHATHPDYRSAW